MFKARVELILAHITLNHSPYITHPQHSTTVLLHPFRVTYVQLLCVVSFGLGWDMFMENTLDPAHVPVSHHNIVGNR
jgi:hypothetical protein